MRNTFRVGDQVTIDPDWIDHLKFVEPANEWTTNGPDYVYKVIRVDEDSVHLNGPSDCPWPVIPSKRYGGSACGKVIPYVDCDCSNIDLSDLI